MTEAKRRRQEFVGGKKRECSGLCRKLGDHHFQMAGLRRPNFRHEVKELGRGHMTENRYFLLPSCLISHSN